MDRSIDICLYTNVNLFLETFFNPLACPPENHIVKTSKHLSIHH